MYGESTALDLSVMIPNFCGDTICESGESCSACPGDCGACAPPPVDTGSSSSGSSSSSSGGVAAIPPTVQDTDDDNLDDQSNDATDENETVCEEDWKCSEWFECFNSRQKRVCMDLNSCDTNENKPIVTQECEMSSVPITTNEEKTYIEKEEEPKENTFSAITGKFLSAIVGNAPAISIIALILLFAGGLLVYRKKGTKTTTENHVN